MNNLINEKTVSTRVSQREFELAEKNLSKKGLSISEYLRLTLIKAADDEVRLIPFENSQEVVDSKKMIENNQGIISTDLNGFEEMIRKIQADEN